MSKVICISKQLDLRKVQTPQHFKMGNRANIIRPLLFGVRLLLWLSAVITLALTAWVVAHLKGYRAIFTLVVVSLRSFFDTLKFRGNADSAFKGSSCYSILHTLSSHCLDGSQPWLYDSFGYSILRSVCRIIPDLPSHLATCDLALHYGTI